LLKVQNNDGQTPLIKSADIFSSGTDQKPFLHSILNNSGPVVNVVDKKGNTALHYAASHLRNNYPKYSCTKHPVYQLLAIGASPLILDANGKKVIDLLPDLPYLCRSVCALFPNLKIDTSSWETPGLPPIYVPLFSALSDESKITADLLKSLKGKGKFYEDDLFL